MREIKFINTCGCRVFEPLLEMAILQAQETPTYQTRKIFMHGRYPAVTVNGNKKHVHRLLLEHFLGPLDRRIYVHHKDGNPLNATLRNLEIIAEGKHQSLHNRGKTLSAEHRRKIATAGKRRKGMKVKKRYNLPVQKIWSMRQRGMSVNAIAKHFRVDWSTIKSRLHQNPELAGGSK